MFNVQSARRATSWLETNFFIRAQCMEWCVIKGTLQQGLVTHIPLLLNKAWSLMITTVCTKIETWLCEGKHKTLVLMKLTECWLKDNLFLMLLRLHMWHLCEEEGLNTRIWIVVNLRSSWGVHRAYLSLLSVSSQRGKTANYLWHNSWICFTGCLLSSFIHFSTLSSSSASFQSDDFGGKSDVQTEVWVSDMGLHSCYTKLNLLLVD